MKLLPSINAYKASNNTFSIQGGKLRAVSYDWWVYVTTDEKGNVVFNNTSYSNSTNKHQSNTRGVLRCLNIGIDLTLQYTRESLSDVNKAVQDEICCIKRSIANLRETMTKKGARKAKNEERAKQCEALTYRIKDLQAYLSEGRLPATEGFLSYWSEETVEAHKTRLEKYFLKPNGVVQRNELNTFLKQRLNLGNVPESLAGLQALFGKNNTVTMLSYQYADDLERMLPAIDSDEHMALLKALKRMKIDKETLTTLDLDKVHTFLINLSNKKEYTPREPEPLPVHPRILSLVDKEDLQVINTVQALRAEGRHQSHCIGGANYIQLCKQGYQALNYKGFTFLLTPDLSVREAKGRHNSDVPGSVQEELKTLIA